MAGRSGSLPVTAKVLVALLLAFMAAVGSAAPQDLQLGIGNRRMSIRSRTHEGRTYYRLGELADILNLSLVERGGLLGISGTRGNLQLTDGRPLVRFQEQYLLLTAPVWRRSPGDWYVPEDFLTKIAPLLIDARLQRVGDHRYRVEALGENQVRVEVVNYPDHVAIVFVPSRPAPIRIQEFDRFLRVSFDEYAVVPRLPETSPDPSLVSRLRFDPGDLYGSFEIEKGSRYHSYRDYDLADPQRKVLGVYGPPVSSTAPVAADPAPVATRPSPDVTLPIVSDEEAREFRMPNRGNAITIDPGHGGENYGVRPSQELLEKNYAQRLAEEVGRQLQGSRYQVFYTRTRDINLSAQQRSSLANFNRSKVFLSLHFGGSHDKALRGPVVYIQEPVDEPLGSPQLVPWDLGQQRYLAQSRELAEALQKRLNQVFGTDNEVVEAPLTVLAPVTAPAVLVEAGFLTNSEDQALFAQEEGMTRIGKALVEALEEFLE